MKAFQVIFTYKNGFIQDDIALSAENKKEALHYVRSRADEFVDKPIKIEVKIISNKKAEDIANYGGIDWYN